MVTIAQLEGIPYIDAKTLSGRFLPSLAFHDETWRLWIVAGNDGEMLIEVQGFPAEACYFARQPEAPDDLYLPFFNFLAQRANYLEMQRAFHGVQDDIFNLSGSLAKLDLLQQSHDAVPHGLSRMATGEIEYFIVVLRSLFDLYQEALMKLWDNIILVDASITKQKLKKSFADMLTFKDKPADATTIAGRFGLPLGVAEGYARSRTIFDGLKKLRDNLVHNGSQAPHLFAGPGPFVIALRDNPFPELGIWEESERQPNDLVPLLPVLETLLYRSFLICDELAAAFLEVIQLPPPVAPSMAFFAKGYFTGKVVDAIASGSRRASFEPLARKVDR
jgi:hypothetical protein